MHYNQFTIDYILAIKHHLKIEVNQNGRAVFFNDLIQEKDVLELKQVLSFLWSDAEKSIDIIKSKKDSKIQAGLFGIVEDLELAIKVGFLIADRVILIDFLFKRILNSKNIDLVKLGVVSSFLVSLLPLAEKGRIVIIPNPFDWNDDSKSIIKEVSNKTLMTPNLMSLLNMLSITRLCNLHPYTIAESEEITYEIIDNNINFVDSIGKHAGNFAYEGIMGALISEKLLQNSLLIPNEIPLSNYWDFLSIEKDFQEKYLNYISKGISLDLNEDVIKLTREISRTIEIRNKNLPHKLKKQLVSMTGIASGSVSLLISITGIVSWPISAIGALMGLSSTLVNELRTNNIDPNPVINIFTNFSKES
jgi:hypothetical protein